jgi:membrane fusion protein (multidrug efflux system)
VSKGALLYTIDAQPFKARLVEAQSQLAAARTNHAKALADLGRIRPLAEINAVSAQDLDGAVAQEEASLAGVRAAEAGVELAEIELGYTRITAPIAGLIGLTKAKPGEFVGREPNPVVLNTLSDIDPILVRFSISEREYLRLARPYLKSHDGTRRTGGPGAGNSPDLDLILADGSEHSEAGKLEGSAQSIDPQTGTYSVEASFPNPDKFLLPGQFARVRAPVETLENVLVVPRQAVVEIQGLFRAFVVDREDVVQVREIKLGPVKGNDVVVESGLAEGDSLVVEGLQKVKAGMKVLPKPFVPAGPTGGPADRA